MALNNTTQNSTNPGLSHLQTWYLSKQALDVLATKCLFAKPCERKALPKNTAKTIQFMRYDLMALNTTPNANEGQTGTGKTISSRTVNISVGQYDDFLVWSDFHQATDPMNIASEYTNILSIQAAVSNDTIIRAMFDAEAANANVQITLTGTNFRRQDVSLIRTKLQGANVLPRENGNYLMIIHPNFTYDLQNDPTAGGWMDLTKYTDPSKGAYFKMEDRGYIGTVNGVELWESTNVYNSGGTYRAYAFGKGCAGIVDLEGMGPKTVEDPLQGKFNIDVVMGGKAAIYDPTGVMGGLVSYKYYFGMGVLDGPNGLGGTYRFKTLDATTGVV